jgi:hypothetical protein
MIKSGLVEAQEPRMTIRELDHRGADGIEVTLLWNAETKGVLVSVAEREGNTLEFQVPAAEALDAFHHPYAYAALDQRQVSRGIRPAPKRPRQDSNLRPTA